MTVNFNRDSKGMFTKDASIYSIFHGTSSYLLEDELNESQWNQIERHAALLREQYSNGFLGNYTIDNGYSNFFSITSIDSDELSLLIDGYLLKIGGNILQGTTLPDGLTPADNRVIFKLNSVGASNRTDLILLEAWFESIAHDESLKKFGGVDTVNLTNNIYDTRIDTETTRRVQFRWRVRTIDGTSSMTSITALKYDGVDSDITYNPYSNIYIADTGIQHNSSGDLKSAGIVYGVPLFTVTRNASDTISLGNITILSTKLSIGSVNSISAGTGLTKNNDIISIADTGVTSGQYTKVTVNAQGQVTNAGNLAASDIPALTLSKISDAGTVASKNTGTASGNIPILDASGKLNSSVLPSAAIIDTFVVADQTSMLALTAQQGDFAVRTDVSRTYILKGSDPSAIGNWQEIVSPASTGSGSVSSVNGRVGDVTLSASDVGLDNVTNESKTTMFTSPTFTGTPAISGSTLLSTDNSTSIPTTAWIKGLNYITSTGNAATATKLQTARTITLTGDATASATNFDGSANISITTTLKNTGTAGTYAKVTTDAQGRITSGTTLLATDIPTLTLSKISDAGTAASKNTGTASGNVPILDVSGKLDTSILPGLALTTTNVVASQTAMLALTAETGDLAVRTDLNKTFVLKGADPTVLANWQELLTPTDLVQSVAGKTGVVTLTSSDVGLGNVTNESKTTMFTSPTFTGVATASQFVSTIASGTSPFNVSSNTRVDNLNADKVDGYDFNQSLKTTDTPTFAGLNIGSNPVTTSASTVKNQLVNASGGYSLLSFTPTTASNFMIGVYLRVTATTTITVSVTYTDNSGDSAQTTNIVNAQSFNSGSYSLLPLFLYSTATNIQVNINANTANQVYASCSAIQIG